MSAAQTLEPVLRKPLRVWPGIVAGVLLFVGRFGLKQFVPGFEGFSLAVQSGFLGVLAILLWWLFLSRARWFERLGAVALMIVALAASWFVRHESMGPLWMFAYAIPSLGLAFVGSIVATRRLADGPRRAVVTATILLACGGWLLLRSEGISGDHVATFAWRWSATPEEKLLTQAGDEPAALPPAPAPAAEPATERAEPPIEQPPAAPPPAPAAEEVRAEWPGFRGPARDGVIRGVRIATDWSLTPPAELWRRPVGPGWSSFAVRGGLIYTQEQRGDDEVVACYRLWTGEPVWAHRDAARFFEANAGAGPRATPTLDGGRVYTLGATGILNVLDAATGARVWRRNVAADTGAEMPYWGFASSPLVVDDLVIVSAAGQLVAYDRASGQPRWRGPAGNDGYSSPHLATLDGITQVLLLNKAGVTSVAPADGTLLWEHRWPGVPIVQPALTAESDLLLAVSAQSGTRRIAVARAPGGWTAEERWTSIGLKPYFNDFVVHKGHAYGFDGRILACLDLADGQRKWKGGRYGSGQLVLLPDQDLLLVLSEQGELALVGATTDQFTELARFPAIEGKTWNHPVLVGDVLLVRNGQEMAAFRLPLAER